jgi:hypothetical protein
MNLRTPVIVAYSIKDSDLGEIRISEMVHRAFFASSLMNGFPVLKMFSYPSLESL